MKEQNAQHEKDIQIPQTSLRGKISVHGKTPDKLLSFLVQSYPAFDHYAVTIEAYEKSDLFDNPTCALACDCFSRDAAQKLVADLHRAVVAHMTRGDAEMRKHRIMVDLLTFALYCRAHLRMEMMQDEFHRPMYEEMEPVVDEAKALLSEEMVRGYNEWATRREKNSSSAGGDHAESNQEHVFVGDAKPSAPRTVDPGADPVAGDRQGSGDPLL